jgi:hypothetical protein
VPAGGTQRLQGDDSDERDPDIRPTPRSKHRRSGGVLSDCSPELLSGFAGRTLWYTISGAPLRFMHWRAVFPWLAFSGG